MYYQKFIDFLKRHNLYNEEVLTYWKNNKMSFDYREEEQRELIGVYYIFKKNILEKIQLIVPFTDNDKTVLINIHEYIHLFLLYPYINKRCIIDKDKEVLPFYYERLYIEENNTEELKKYYQYLNSCIIKDNIDEYTIALEISDILLSEYRNNDIKRLQKHTKKLMKKMKK